MPPRSPACPAGEHIFLVRLHAGLVERVYAEDVTADAAGLLEEVEQRTDGVCVDCGNFDADVGHPAIDLANFDLSVAPNADFYEYATGGWQKNNPLKPEYSRYGSFDILRDNNEKRDRKSVV